MGDETFTIIPNTILFDSSLNIYARCLYGLILSLSKEKGYCFASNEYLAEKLGAKKRSAVNWILELKEKGFIDVETIRRQGSVERKIFIRASTYPTNASTCLSVGNNDALAKGITMREQRASTFPIIDNNNNKELIDNINKENAELKNSSHTQQNENFENDILQLEPLDDEPVKKRKKVAQKKEKEIVKIYPHNFSSEMIRAADEFFEYRKEIKKPLKSEKSINTKMNQWSKEINQYGENAVIESINSSIANGYQGTFIKLDKNYQNGFNNNNTDTFKEFLRKGSNFEL